MYRRISVAIACAGLLAACESPGSEGRPPAAQDSLAAAPSGSAIPLATDTVALAGTDTAHRAPSTAGKIPILEYHIIGDSSTRWRRDPDDLRSDFELLYQRGYRPISASELIDKRIDIPPGTSPVVVTFDDASPGQFRYLERADGSLEIDPTSAVGIWLEFAKTHRDWRNVAVFCMLPGATDGHAFFGDKGIQGQKTAWRFAKVKFLAEQGFELCAHTLWHADLAKYSDEMVQEQIARGVMAIDSAVPGYRVRAFALPLGDWPKNRALAKAGSWRDPKTGRVVSYDFDAVLQVSGGLQYSPAIPAFDPLRMTRVQVFDNELTRWLDLIERRGERYVR